LLIGIVSISACSQMQPTEVRLKPVTPQLETVTEINGSMCMSRRDATTLGLYILELERGYQ
ncbi:hypothetical protein FPK88_25160, partial [Acinetobacter baumannii]|nr:hypothetical protein [Acinetobacter baumannii]